MKNIKASILIINYNNKKYLSQCLNSIINQSFGNQIEIIFHDDNSTDNSLKEIKKFKNIKIIKNKLRTSYGSYNQIKAVKRALAVSSGNIIFLLDSDDFFSKNKIKKILNYFNKNKDIDLIFDLPALKIGNKLKKNIFKKKNFQRHWNYIHPQSCISLRRKLLKQIISKVDFKKFPDIWLDFRISIYAKYILKKFYIFNEYLTIYRITNNSASSAFKKFSKNWWTRRSQAHAYVKYFFKKNKIKYKENIDYVLTTIINKILK